MRFEHTVVVPLALPEARRLLDEFERRSPSSTAGRRPCASVVT
jgi:hypothetical protein